MITVYQRSGHVVTLNKSTIASVRPTTTNDGSFIVTTGGACYTVNDSYWDIEAQLA